MASLGTKRVSFGVCVYVFYLEIPLFHTTTPDE